MAFSRTFRDYEASRLKRADSGPFARFQTLFDKYKGAGDGLPELAKSRPGLSGSGRGFSRAMGFQLEKPADMSNSEVSKMANEARSRAETDTTFNDRMSKAINNYNRAARVQQQRDQAALASSPNRRVRRRT